MPQEKYVEAILVAGSYTDHGIEQLIDLKLGVTYDANEPDENDDSCGGGFTLPYDPQQDPTYGTSEYANGAEVWCDTTGTHVHLVKEVIPGALQTELLANGQNY